MLSKKKSQNNSDNNEIVFKIITLGDSGVGKSSIIKRYISGKFEEKTISTIGFGSFNKEITVKGTKIKLNLIDTAGQENYRALSASYIKNADGALFVFAYNDKKSFDGIKQWLNNYKDINPNLDFNKKIPAYLVGNKCDLELVDIDKEEIEKLKEENNFYDYIKTSAKEGDNIEEVFQKMGEMFIEIYGKRKNKQTSKLVQKRKKGGGCHGCGPDT